MVSDKKKQEEKIGEENVEAGRPVPNGTKEEKATGLGGSGAATGLARRRGACW